VPLEQGGSGLSARPSAKGADNPVLVLKAVSLLLRDHALRFDGCFPLIAIELQAIQVGEEMAKNPQGPRRVDASQSCADPRDAQRQCLADLLGQLLARSLLRETSGSTDPGDEPHRNRQSHAVAECPASPDDKRTNGA
jgi:hypothetical protein